MARYENIVILTGAGQPAAFEELNGPGV